MNKQFQDKSTSREDSLEDIKPPSREELSSDGKEPKTELADTELTHGHRPALDPDEAKALEGKASPQRTTPSALEQSFSFRRGKSPSPREGAGRVLKDTSKMFSSQSFLDRFISWMAFLLKGLEKKILSWFGRRQPPPQKMPLEDLKKKIAEEEEKEQEEGGGNFSSKREKGPAQIKTS